MERRLKNEQQCEDELKAYFTSIGITDSLDKLKRNSIRRAYCRNASIGGFTKKQPWRYSSEGHLTSGSAFIRNKGLNDGE